MGLVAGGTGPVRYVLGPSLSLEGFFFPAEGSLAGEGDTDLAAFY